MSDDQRLERRLARERRARREAEAIAEATTRSLYDRQRELTLLTTVTSAANEADSPNTAIMVALEQICAHTGWPLGHAFVRAKDSEAMVATSLWAGTDPERFDVLRDATEGTTFASGVGLPGRVLASGQPAWIAEIGEDQDFLRQQPALEAGVRAAFAFPIVARGEVNGVLEFFTTSRTEPDEQLLAVMAQVGGQLGRVIERARGEQELQELNEELLRSNRELEEFAYIASHDLSEPLRMVTSYLQLIERRYAGQLDADADEFIRFAVDGGRRMQRLIQDLLEYSRAGRATLRPEDVPTQELFADAVRNLGMRGAQADARIEAATELPVVKADRSQLARVLQNLISNGVKFMPDGETAHVVVAAAREDAGWRFRITDNGIGVPVDQADRVFRMFQRLHPRDQYEGTGIGLPICRRIVERHGGHIELYARPDGQAGTEVSFWLPDSPPVSRTTPEGVPPV